MNKAHSSYILKSQWTLAPRGATCSQWHSKSQQEDLSAAPDFCQVIYIKI